MEDKLTEDQRIRLEALALAVSGATRASSTEIVGVAKVFEDYIKNGSANA